MTTTTTPPPSPTRAAAELLRVIDRGDRRVAVRMVTTYLRGGEAYERVFERLNALRPDWSRQLAALGRTR